MHGQAKAWRRIATQREVRAEYRIGMASNCIGMRSEGDVSKSAARISNGFERRRKASSGATQQRRRIVKNAQRGKGTAQYRFDGHRLAKAKLWSE